MINRDICLRTHNTHSMLPAVTEPTIPASEWPQNHALESGATDISFLLHKLNEQHRQGISRGKYISRLLSNLPKNIPIIVNDFTLISVSYQIINFVFVELL
jgi:hypothetical protein